MKSLKEGALHEAMWSSLSFLPGLPFEAKGAVLTDGGCFLLKVKENSNACA